MEGNPYAKSQMRKVGMAVSLACLLAFMCLTRVFALPTFEPFSDATASGGTAYATGAALCHQTNSLGEGWAQWNGGTTSSGVSCTNAGLSYGNFPAAFPAASPTNAAYLPGQVDNAGGVSGLSAALNLSRRIQADPNNLATNKIFASFLIQVPNLGNLTSNGPIYFGGFATNTGDQSVTLPTSALKVFVEGNATTAGTSTTWAIGVANNSGASSGVFDGGGHSSNTVLFVVVDYEFGLYGGADVAQIWVNPAATSFGAGIPPASTGSISITAPNKIAQAADFFLLDRTGGTIWGRLAVSDLRLGTTWSYVTGGPEIITPPASVTNAALGNTTFQVSAASGSSNDPLSYQWQFNGVNLTDGNGIAGSATASLILSNVTETSAGTYSVIVSNALGMVTASAVLTVIDPYIATQPAAVQNLPSGSTASFSVTAMGTAPLTYRWMKNGVNLSDGSTGYGSTVSGSTTASLTINDVTANDSGTYTVTVMNGLGGTVASANSVLNVNDPVVVSAPQNVLTNYGRGASFSVVVAGTPPFGYQWLKNGTTLSNGPTPSGAMVSGSHGTNLLMTGLAYSDSGNYTVIITNGAGNTVTSSPAILTVIDPYVVTSPVNQTNVLPGTTATFSVVASGTSPIAYQWQQNGMTLSDNGHDVGTATATLTISNVSGADAGTYSVIVSGAGQSGGTQNSITNSAVLTVPAPGLLPFPLSANQEGTVTCLKDPAIKYNIYLPPGYSTNGPPLPILYTMSPSGGGEVSIFYTACSNLNIIDVGLINPADSTPWNVVLRDFFAVPRDIQQRVLFDPTAVFVGGLSGGGEYSYVFSRFWPQQVSGVLPMGGWLGYVNSGPTQILYNSTVRVQTNLLVARTTGTSDTAGNFYLPYDKEFLTNCGAIVADWSFSGGHTYAPTSVQIECLQWLLSERTPAGSNDESLAVAQAQDWLAEAAAGRTETVVSNCIATMMNQPRSWYSFEAQVVLDDLMTNYNSFCLLNVSNLMPASASFITNVYSYNLSVWSQSDYASDMLYFYARGAATNEDWAQYECAMKLLTGINGTCGDRAGDIYYVLTNFSYAAPLLQISQPDSGNMDFSITEDTPGLNYSLQWESDLTSDAWQDSIPISTNDTGTVWSAIMATPDIPEGFYRVTTTPNYAAALQWPNNSAGQ